MVFAVPKNAVRFFFVEMIRNQLRYLELLAIPPVFSQHDILCYALIVSLIFSPCVVILACSDDQQKRKGRNFPQR